MKWTLILSMTLAASIAAGCNLPTGATPASPASPASTAISASPIAPTAALPAVPTVALPCLESGDQNTINARLKGIGAIANLCPGAVFELTEAVTISADRQQIYTEGFPTDETRATLRIVSTYLTAAVQMRDYNGVVLSNLILDGNRPALGQRDGEALIRGGGFSDGQIIRGNRLMNTRSWSSLHLVEGYSASQPCTNALVEDNEIVPSGTSESMKWADGISLACRNSTVRNNLITDPTDGGIVIFGAPGSIVEGNTIRAETRTLLGGINMVDDGVYQGNFTGTIVRGNVIDAAGAAIRIGLGMGPRVWLCEPAGANRFVTGGTVTGNTLRGQHMQYGFIADGVKDWTVTGNVDEATHTGTPSVDCAGVIPSRPAGFLYNPARATGTFQPEFKAANLDLALWAIVSPRPGQ